MKINEDAIEELTKALKEMDKKRVKELEPNSRKLFDAIMKMADERDKYKSLYENEKDKNDTLIRIIKKAKEELKKRLTARDYSNHKYELFGREYLEELYDLLKEIK